ncbi:aromatic acid/H+ symport family MFS transporter [Janthinobacterium sp. SUN073]|uniref:MFS transporter n=1 Tax=Janthinobacterium sp. SUN073 TaxID=3004102 RepID=UPI0025B21F4A|nr:aromatic acid/H+ symport family MFS transporter [Janthinobacterium sp. SUN073]MDN2696667.1 aromatic acid/H+ symport family MFS transporter [Janthinobacterium sp. SUN073]
MTTHAGTDVQHFLDSHPFSRYQKLILWLCFLIVAIDGFDTASIGFIAPAIRAEWGLTPAALAPLFGAGLFGLMAGSFLFGPLADRYGRRPVLIVSVAFFGAASLLSAWSTDLTMLLVLRFLTGLGLGGAMPTSVTMTSEYCPQQRRSGLVTMMFCGFTIGSALGGLASAQLLHLIGWRGVLMLGGALPLLLVPVLLLALPESLRWLVLKGRDGNQVLNIVRRIAPTLAALPRLVVSDKKLAGSPMAELFRPGVIGGTLLLWSTFFMSLLIIYLLSSWMPTLLSGNGLSLSNASLVTMMFQVGGTVGAIMLGRWMDRHSPHKVLSIAYLAAAGCIVVVALSGSSLAVLVLAVFGVGFGVSGSQVGANALAAAFYPTSSRATGVSWAAAVGRSGSVLGSMAGGLMLTLKLDNETIFFLLAIPAVLASLALLAMGRLMRTRTAASAVPATLKESTV